MTSRFVAVGPDGNNECCVCGFLGNQDDSAGNSCSGVCTSGNNNLYGANPGEGGVPCFPQTCCPCPATGDGRTVTLTLTASCAAGGVAETITLTASDGISICSGDNPAVGGGTCYTPDSLGQTGTVQAYEKYGKKDHIFSGIVGDEGGPCPGAKADIALCCCGAHTQATKAGSTGECHTCNYVLTMQFHPVETDPDTNYCHCPSGYTEGTQPKTQILPGYTNAEASSDTDLFNEFVLVSSRCDPFILTFEANGLYWNCGPCMNGEEEDVSNNVNLTAVIS